MVARMLGQPSIYRWKPPVEIWSGAQAVKGGTSVRRPQTWFEGGHLGEMLGKFDKHMAWHAKRKMSFQSCLDGRFSGVYKE